MTPVSGPQQIVLWLTPKIFRDLRDPGPRVREFFDHYADCFHGGGKVVVNFCTGNGDHVLSWAGPGSESDSFEWARFNSYGGTDADPHSHNLDWLTRVREGGERSYNPYCAGPMVIMSEQVMDYDTLRGIYAAFRAEAAARDLDLALLEYLEPGPEFCPSLWKDKLHPEAAPGSADAGGNIARGVIDVCAPLHGDDRRYAAFPTGIPADTETGEFVARQTAAYVEDFGIDGIFLGNQFGLLGFWHPDNAPEPTPERRAGISRFFRRLREEMGDRLIYWMDTYWPVPYEDERWAMSRKNYACLDAVMCCNFAVLVDKAQIIPNLESKLAVAAEAPKPPAVLFSTDFVDPWYAYRVHLDHREIFEFQHKVYREHGSRAQGLSFFANDTFGHFVPQRPLAQTWAAVTEGHARVAAADAAVSVV